MTQNREIALLEAFLNAGEALGMSQSQLETIIGKEITSIGQGMSPDSGPGEAAMMLVRCYEKGDRFILFLTPSSLGKR
ncbi:hypothetical protein [Candidatus Thiodiazotropha sp. LNASS1]|uniref:hypothetical protein n=1 Tax=Candidatus Thiodiazotropha sp. LNASS1 TaxID=3096260 RepID=UPI0034DDEA85